MNRLLPTAGRLPPVVYVAAALLFTGIAAGGEAEGEMGKAEGGRGAETQSTAPLIPNPQSLIPPYRVFIPIDENKKPTGGRYHVPRELYDRLHRREAAATEQSQGWLIAAATYRGVLRRETATDRLVVAELKAKFDLHVFGFMARVRIPFGRRRANLLPDGAVLDGVVIHPEWEADRGTLMFEIAEPGPHRLELALRPTIRAGDSPAGFDVHIPRLATSRLELSLPAGAPEIEVPSAVGSVRIEEEPPRLIAQLGPADHLSVRWGDVARAGGTGPAVDVEELLWLKVRPSSMALDARFKFKIVEGQVRQLRLAAEGRLRLLPLGGDDPPAVQVRAEPGGQQIISLKWPRPVAKDVVVRATFLLTGTSGVGNLRIPELGSLDARPTRRWMAVSVDPTLEYDEQTPDRLKAVAVPDFVAAWGKVEKQPLLAYRLPSGETAWSMSTRPREPQRTVEQTLALSFEHRSAEVYFDARLATTGYVFQHRLSGPRGLEIEHVSLLEEGIERAARWSQDKDGKITVFLTGPVTGEQELSLRGRLPTPKRQMSLPTIQIDRGKLKSSTVQLFRRRCVLVEVGRTNGVAEENLPADPSKAELGRPVRRLRVEGPKPLEASLTLAPNRPKVRARQVTRLRPDGEAWTVQFDCLIRAEGGVVDEVRIAAPGPFSGPYKVGSPADLKVIDAPGAARQLVIRPQAAIISESRLSVSGPLSLAPGDRPGLPEVTLRQVDELKRFVLLPKQAQGQPIAWETRGLKQTELPEDLATPSDAESFVAYEVTGELPRAVLVPAAEGRRAARVRTADIRFAWAADRTCRGVATFDLEPGKSSQCPLRLPDGCRLLQVTVAGLPTAPVSTGGNSWRVALGPQDLPQRIEVLFDGNLPAPESITNQRFDAPSLGDLPVGQTLWTVAGPAPFEPGKPADGGLIAPWRHELSRLENIAAIIQSGGMAAAEDPDSTRRWYRLWARRLVASRAAVQRELAQAGETKQARAGRTKLQTIDREQSRIAGQLGVAAIVSELSAAGSVADTPAELWRLSLGARQAVTRCSLPGAAASITLAYFPAEATRGPLRPGPAIVLIVLILLILLGLRQEILAGWFKHWPHATGVAVGLAWWLWLSPSILGWGIVAVSLGLSFLSGWRGSAAAPDSSIITVRSIQR